jgi:predicted Zn-dependent peptidase
MTRSMTRSMPRTLLAVAVIAAHACRGAGPAAPTTPTPAVAASAPGPSPAAPAAPAPADPPPKTDGDVTEAWLHGMQILVKRIPGAETAATQLYIRGGATNWGKPDAGIEQLAVAVAASGGTERLAKDPFTQRLSELGSAIDAQSSEDYAVFDAWSLTPTWDETFELLVDAFRHPALPPAQIELVRARQLSALRHELDDPDGRLSMIAHLGIFKGHPYENRPIGTLETVGGFTAKQLAAHLARLRETSRLLLVVVGDVDPGRVIAAAGRALGDLPRGSYAARPLPALASRPGSVAITEQKLPTNYILAMFPGPTWSDPDFFAARVAMTALGQREFKEVRTKRNLSYAPGAWLEWNRNLPTGALYVTAVDPVATMKVMLDEARRLRDEPIPEHELAATKATMLTAAFVGGEAPADQAAQLAGAQIHGGDWRLVRSLPDRVRAVTAAQIQAWAGKHLGRLQAFVIGDPSKIDRKTLEAF